jgi:hypothetical protein
MKLPIYDLIINQDENNDAEVSFVALVDSPAIKKDFLAFKEEEFIDPNKGEQKDEFLSRCISYVINEGKETEQAVAICNSLWEQHFAACPVATQDIKINLKNRGTAISVANYGPANPSLPNEQYWIDKGNIFGGSPEDAKTMTCNNCAAFNRSKEILDCIAQGLGNNTAADPWATIDAGDLGYCEIFDFKCASSRTCDAWVAKQQMAAKKVSFDYDDTLSTSKGKDLAKKELAAGNIVFIISARSDKSPMLAVAKDLGIPESRVFATGSNKAKVEKVKALGIAKHYDNNADVIKELGGIGEKFMLMAFAIQSESEHIITGPLMIPQQLIYRNSEQFGEHYVKFSVDTIKQIAIKFSKKGYQKNVNLMHEADLQVEGLTMFESFISDSKRGIKPMEAFKDLPDGTWFGSFYVENPKVWELIKKGEVKGFSVEGMFDYETPMSEDQKQLAELREILNSF